MQSHNWVLEMGSFDLFVFSYIYIYIYIYFRRVFLYVVTYLRLVDVINMIFPSFILFYFFLSFLLSSFFLKPFAL